MKPHKKAYPASGSQNTMIKVMSPLDANHYGYVHGGAIMRYVDEAAFIAGTRHARRNIVTAAVDQHTFEAPVKLGDLLILKSSVNYVGKTSMEIGVRVEAEDPMTGETKFVGRAYITMVALDDMGNPTALPPLILETKEDKDRNKRAQQRRDMRLKLRKK